MKKWLSLTLAIVMVLMLVACGTDTTDGDIVTEGPVVTEPADIENNKEEKVELSRGKIDGDVYTNEFLGFEFTKPDSWMYYSDEEVAALMNLTADEVFGVKFNDALENNVVVYDMMVIDTLTGSNFNVGYENLSKTFNTNITVEQYVAALEKQLGSVSAMTVTFPDTYESVKLGNTEFTKVVCSVEAQGINMTQVYYLHKTDGYMCFVIVTIPSGYTVSEIEAMFK